MLHLLQGKHIASVVTVTGCAASLFCMLYHSNLDLYGILKPEEDASELVFLAFSSACCTLALLT